MNRGQKKYSKNKTSNESESQSSGFFFGSANFPSCGWKNHRVIRLPFSSWSLHRTKIMARFAAGFMPIFLLGKNAFRDAGSVKVFKVLWDDADIFLDMFDHLGVVLGRAFLQFSILKPSIDHWHPGRKLTLMYASNARDHTHYSVRNMSKAPRETVDMVNSSEETPMTSPLRWFSGSQPRKQSR